MALRMPAVSATIITLLSLLVKKRGRDSLSEKTRVPFVRREKVSIFSGCNSRPARGRSSR
jgi:hypothetical protein